MQCLRMSSTVGVFCNLHNFLALSAVAEVGGRGSEKSHWENDAYRFCTWNWMTRGMMCSS